MDSPTQSLGRRGEALACRLLKKARLKILARNYRCPAGEIDIIALDPTTRKADGAETIVFVEVKTRATVGKASPAIAVDAHKRAQIEAAARYYLRHHPARAYRTRYDIVAIVLAPDAEPDIRHISNAF